MKLICFIYFIISLNSVAYSYLTENRRGSTNIEDRRGEHTNYELFMLRLSQKILQPWIEVSLFDLAEDESLKQRYLALSGSEQAYVDELIATSLGMDKEQAEHFTFRAYTRESRSNLISNSRNILSRVRIINMSTFQNLTVRSRCVMFCYCDRSCRSKIRAYNSYGYGGGSYSAEVPPSQVQESVE